MKLLHKITALLLALLCFCSCSTAPAAPKTQDSTAQIEEETDSTLVYSATVSLDHSIFVGNVSFELQGSKSTSVGLIPGNIANNDSSIDILPESESCFVFLVLEDVNGAGELLEYELSKEWLPLFGFKNVYYLEHEVLEKPVSYGVFANGEIRVRNDLNVSHVEKIGSEGKTPRLELSAVAVSKEEEPKLSGAVYRYLLSQEFPLEIENAVSLSYPELAEGAETLTLESEYGALLDLESGKIIASKNADSRIYPASMTKLMTVILAYENTPDSETAYTFDDYSLFNELYLANAAVAGFTYGETVTVKDLMYATLLPSGGDGAMAIADLVAGGEEEFSFIMNEKAKRIGMKNTNFVTCTGLHDDDHYSTCQDMALLLEYAISIPEIKEMLCADSYTTTPTDAHPYGITLTSVVKSRISSFDTGDITILGGKTGFTYEAMNCLASFACGDGSEEARYIFVSAYGNGNYVPVRDAVSTYEKYCK